MSIAAKLRRKAEALARYNAWEKELAEDVPNLADRLAWLEEAYELAVRFGSLKQLPTTEEAWYKEVSGIQIMHERLALLDKRDG